MSELPSGTITFLFTDIENSTPLWEQAPVAMEEAHARHGELIAACVQRYGGSLIQERGEGDSTFSVFPTAASGLAACCDFQRALLAEPWPEETPIRVRAALHTGTATAHNNNYNTSDVNRCARIRSLAHGGQTLVSQTVYDLTHDRLPAGFSLKELGSYHLRGLKHPEQVYQLNHPDLPTHFPALRAPDSHLPIQLTSFVGREREIAEIRDLLKSHRLLTLTGPGGSGKTRLAFEVAAKRLHAYPDGVRLVELASLPADPRSRRIHANSPQVGRLVQALATAIGVKETVNIPLVETLESSLLSKQMLLIVDNCEHLSAACSWLIERLLRSNSGLRILATSRAPLSIEGEQEYVVLPLPTFPLRPVPALEALLKSDASTLFAERARLVSPEFSLTQENAPIIARICRRLDGLPFAIELVAGRARNFSVRQIETNLKQLLAGLSHSHNTRHKTMEALIRWSYDPLSPEAKTLLQRLSIFSSSWSLEAAMAICSAQDLPEHTILDLLDHLCNVSMVMGVEIGEEQRYHLLETVRNFMQERLQETGQESVMQVRYLDYFLVLAEEAEPHITLADQKFWLERLEVEHDNFRAALQSAADPEKCLRLAGAFWPFWEMRGYFTEGCAWLKNALNVHSGVSNLTRAKAMNGLGVFLTKRNETANAQQLFQESLRIYAEHKELRRVANVLNNLGTLAQWQEDWQAAYDYHARSLELRRQMQDPWGTAASLNNLGMLARYQGDLDQAREYYAQSREIYRELDDRAKYAAVTLNLGQLANDKDDYATALPLLEEALEQFRVLGSRWYIAVTLHNLSITAEALKGYEVAYPLFAEGMLLRLELEDWTGLIYGVLSAAESAFKQEDYLRAAQLYAAAASNRENSSPPISVGETENLEKNLSMLQQELGMETYASVWEKGFQMPIREAVAYALSK